MKIEIKIRKWRILPNYKNLGDLERLCLENNIPLGARTINGHNKYLILSNKKDWLKIIFEMAEKYSY